MTVVINVRSKNLDLIANADSLAIYNVKTLDSPGNGFVRLSYEVLESSAESSELNPTFHWGFGKLIARLGGLSDSLSDLVKDADTPQQTLAFNHFQKAREAFDNELFELALEEINNSINGDLTSSGYKEEWRFYQLLGIIHLGYYNCDVKLVDLEKAVKAFLDSAELIINKRPADAAYSYLAAGWAAYCLGDISNAKSYTSKAIENNPGLAEAFFQMAKLMIADGNVKESFKYLENAIEKDTFYALKSIADRDFQNHETELTEYLESLRKEKNNKYKSKITADINALRSSNMPADLQKRIDNFTSGKSLLDLSKTERDWEEFKLKPWFYTVEMGDIFVEHDVLVKVVEPYREKVVIRQATWYRREESKFVTKNREVEKKKKQKYAVKIFRDTFTFFTGKVLADYDLVLVEEGNFLMGDSSSTGRSDEKPVQNVKLSPYLICTTQVAQKVWNLVMNNNPSNFEGYNLPVDQISWYDSVEFCNRLSAMAGFTPCYTINKEKDNSLNKNKNDAFRWTITCNLKANGYRLPTEAEWEFAAKGGNSTNFKIFSGSDDVNQVAWYKDNSGYKTQNVGQKQANELGIYDMSGNVWEWCWDWYDNYGLAETHDPMGPEYGAYRVLRGGSWADSKNYQRSTGRGSESPFGRYSSIGLRLVRAYIKKG